MKRPRQRTYVLTYRSHRNFIGYILAEYPCVATGFFPPCDMSHQFNLVPFSDPRLDLLSVDETDISLDAFVVV
jgi:hypothetical protein